MDSVKYLKERDEMTALKTDLKEAILRPPKNTKTSSDKTKSVE